MTATLPLPSAASGASAFSALNVGPMSLTVRDGALALELELALVGAGLAAVGAELGLLPGLQAAISSAAPRPAAVRPALFLRPAVFAREDKNVPRFSLTRLAAAAGAGPPGERVGKPIRAVYRSRACRTCAGARRGDSQTWPPAAGEHLGEAASESGAAAPRRPRPARRTVPRRRTHRARPPRATGHAAMGG